MVVGLGVCVSGLLALDSVDGVVRVGFIVDGAEFGNVERGQCGSEEFELLVVVVELECGVVAVGVCVLDLYFGGDEACAV